MRYFNSAGDARDFRQTQLQKKNLAFQHVELKENKHGFFWAPIKVPRKGKRRADKKT